MFRIMLKSKIHRIKITKVNLYYSGSITLDADLMKKADLLEGERVDIFNLNSGERFSTYVIKGKAGSGMVCLNGPAARKGCVGDEIIIVSYVFVDEKEASKIKPIIIKLNGKNRIKS